ncbi:MAG TPA: hypothetical protein DCM08_08335 [Microscillaceae bacterium]|nr:hypothetical protein [Microscillaceae bacterium]
MSFSNPNYLLVKHFSLYFWIATCLASIVTGLLGFLLLWEVAPWLKFCAITLQITVLYVACLLVLKHQSPGSSSDKPLEEKIAADFFEQMVQTSKNCFFAIAPDHDFRFFYLNEAAADHFEEPLEVVKHYSIRDYDRSYDAAKEKVKFAKLKEIGFVSFETKHYLKNGKIKNVLITSSYFVHNQKEYITGYFTDITKLRKSQAELKTTHDYYEKLLNGSPDIIMLFSETGQILYANPAIESILGYSPVDFYNNASLISSIIAPESQHIFEENRQYLLEHGKANEKTSELKWLTKDGKEVLLQQNIKNTYDSEGKFTGFQIISRDVTALRSTEKQLEQNNALLRAVFESSIQAKILVDKSFNIIDFNTEAESRLVKYQINKKLAVGNPLIDYVFHKDIFINNLQKALSGKKVTTEQQITFGKENQEVWVFTSYVPISDAKGEIIGVSFSSLDITEVKLSQKKLEESEALLEAVFNSGHQTLVLIDKQRKILKFNKAAEKGVARFSNLKLQIGANYLDYIPDWAKDIFLENFALSIQGKEIEGEYPFVSATGQLHYLATFHQPVKGDQGQIFAMAHATIDITEKKQNQLLLQKTLNSLRDVQNAIDKSAVVCITDLQSTIVQVNDAFCELTQYTKEEIKGQNIRILNSNYHSQSLFAEMYKSITEGNFWRGEFKNKRKDGSFFWVDSTIAPITNENNEIYQYIAIWYVVTRRKEAESQNKRLLQQLITQNNDLMQFSYIISHNLRSPVANILGLFNILEPNDQLGAHNEAILEHLQKATLRLDEVIADLNKILEVKNQNILEKEWVNFLDIFEQTKAFFSHHFEPIETLLNFEEVPRFYTVKSYLFSIFYNMVSNAIKYQDPQRPLQIKITSIKMGDYVKLIFQDNGLGIDLTRFRDKLFKLYKRFHLHIDGKGLGLYLVQSQVQALGGYIQVESKEGMGTSFIIFLKFAPEQKQLEDTK